MQPAGITPILNVSDIDASIAWFGKWGWQKSWDYGSPAAVAAIRAGKCSIFLCRNAQGGRGRGSNTATFGSRGDEETSDKGVWLWLAVAEVDELYKRCLEAGIEVTFPPADCPWGSRELHLRHPDGHVFRLASDPMVSLNP